MFSGQVLWPKGTRPSDDTIQEAMRQAVRLRGQKTSAGMQQAIKGFDLEDGSQAYVVDLSNTWTIQIIPPTTQTYVDYTPSYPVIEIGELMPIIGFVSGSATSPRAEHTEDGKLKLKDRLSLVAGGGALPRSRELFSEDEAKQKLAVLQRGEFGTIASNPDIILSQLNSHQSGLFTGIMASVVQLLLGVGKLYRDDYESRWLKSEQSRKQGVGSPITGVLAGDYDDAINVTRADGTVLLSTPTEEVTTAARPSSPDDPFTEFQIPFDPRWNRTHGICWGQRTALENAPDVSLVADPERVREPFLVEIGQRGVYAMPLPRDPASFYSEVREQYKKIYPELDKFELVEGEGLNLFDALGGFPLPLKMPGAQKDLDRWVRAGVVIKSDKGAEEFYNGGTAICSAHGWAFSQNGNQAVNVSKHWVGEVMNGLCFLARFDIQQRSGIVFNPQGEALISVMELTDAVDVHKAHRLSKEQMVALEAADFDYDTFDAMEVIPDWQFSANITMIYAGSISSPYKHCSQSKEPCQSITPPQYKVYEPVLGEVLTVDFSVDRAVRPYLPAANGPIFATFVGDELDVLALYMGGLSWRANGGSTRQPCQFVGGWEDYTYRVTQGLSGYFYSMKTDFRKDDFQESGEVTKFNGSYAGFVDFAFAEFFFSMYIHQVRYALCTHTWQKESWTGGSYNTAVIDAANNRSAYFVAVQSSKQGRSTSNGFSGLGSIGPTGKSRHGRLYNFVFHWTGGVTPCDWPIEITCEFRHCGTYENGGCGAELFPGVEPAAFRYSVCGGTNGKELVVDSPVKPSIDAPGGVLGSGSYGPVPSVPPASTTILSESRTVVEYKIYGMGLPEMHGRVIEEGTREGPSTGDDALDPLYDGAGVHWWFCSIPDLCSIAPWYVLRNYYGVPFVVTNSNLDMGDVVEYGVKPSIQVSRSAILFGVIE